MAKSHKTCMEQAEIIDTFGTYHTTTIIIVITTTSTTVSQLLLIPLCKEVFISGAVELTTQLSKPVRILCVPKCRINKLGYLAREDYVDPLQLRIIKYCFLAQLPGTIALFTGLLEVSLTGINP